MKHIALFVAGWFAIISPAFAETFIWDCNKEADMKEYRGERSDNGGASWGVLFKKDHVPGCAELSYQNTAYVKPGDKLGRLFACDKSGNCSTPSAPPTPYKIAAPIIGNPGGQTETPLPPSPFSGAVVTPPPVVPPAPVVVKPGDVTGLAATSIATDSTVLTFTAPDGAKVNVRYAKAPMSWGSATSADCTGSPCPIADLQPDTTYQAACVPYFGTMNQGAIYGALCPAITFKTLPLITPPPVEPPPVVPPPPPPVDDLTPRVKALEDRLAGIEEMGSVLDAEIRELQDTMKALCRALKGNCP